MDKFEYKMEQAARALRAAAKSIPAAMEEEAIRPDEVHALLNLIADQMELATIRQARDKAA